MSEEIVSIVKNKLQKAVHEKQGPYILIVGECNGVRVVVCLSSNYAKIVLEEDLSALSCREAEYNPAGLYTFSDKPEELIRKIEKKINILIARKTKIRKYQP